MCFGKESVPLEHLEMFKNVSRVKQLKGAGPETCMAKNVPHLAALIRPNCRCDLLRNYQLDNGTFSYLDHGSEKGALK
jgi:hypothetical protein